MASPGDIVECDCGSLEVVPPNVKLQWHKKPGTKFNCPRSGVPVEHWDPVSRCPECEATNQIRNSKPDAKFPLFCASCGTAGSLKTFVDVRKLKYQSKIPIPPKKEGKPTYRYVDSPDVAPPDCPKCGNPQVKSKGGFRCESCARREILELAAKARAATVEIAPSRQEPVYLPVTTALQRAAESAAKAAGQFSTSPALKRAPAVARNLREEFWGQFEGKLSAEDFRDIFELAESYAKQAFRQRKRPSGFRMPAYDPAFDTFQEKYDELQAKLDGRGGEEGQDLAYLAYWSCLERECAEGGVVFRREDMAARGL